jgi:hypothetical protein
MKKVFHFDSPREKYQCDAVILWCFDNRFELAFRKFLGSIGIVHSDPIKIAGGAKCLASPEHETDRGFVLDQIRKSMQLHGTRRAILMLHSDCGAYKDSTVASVAIGAPKQRTTAGICNELQPICEGRSRKSLPMRTSWTLRECGRWN